MRRRAKFTSLPRVRCPMCGERAERLAPNDKLKLYSWRCTSKKCGERFWTEMRKDDRRG